MKLPEIPLGHITAPEMRRLINALMGYIEWLEEGRKDNEA